MRLLVCFRGIFLKVTLKCDQDRTERMAAAAIAGSAAEREHASTRTIAVIAPALEERIARVRKVRVITVPRCSSATAAARLVHCITIYARICCVVI